jgi:hypothetical protein
MARTKKPKYTEQSGGTKPCHWWKASGEEKKPHEMLDNLIRTIRQDQSERYDGYKRYATAFGQDITRFSGDTYTESDKLSINELQNTIETLHAQIFKNHIVPAPCPAEGDYEEQFRARAFGRWLEGILDDAKVFYEVMPTVGLDALVFGTGICKVYSKKAEVGHKICLERISPRDIYVDRIEARYGKPRNIYQRMHMDRWVALDKFAMGADGEYDDELALKIIDAKQLEGEDYDLGDASDGDQITVYEAWHLPSSPKAKDGRHVIWIQGCTLVDEEWEDPTFPFIFMKFGTPLAGFWGCSAVARLMPAQSAYDKLTQRIDLAHDWASPDLLSARALACKRLTWMTRMTLPS